MAIRKRKEKSFFAIPAGLPKDPFAKILVTKKGKKEYKKKKVVSGKYFRGWL